MATERNPEFKCYPNMKGLMRLDDAGYFAAKDAVIVGDVSIGKDSSIWFGCVVRGDDAKVSIGERTNVQDLSCIHVDFDFPVEIGDEVTIGHKATVHGCIVEDRCLIGMGAILLDGCRIGEGSLIAAGTVIGEGVQIPPRSLVMGVPGRVRGEVTSDQIMRMSFGVKYYTRRAKNYL